MLKRCGTLGAVVPGATLTVACLLVAFIGAFCVATAEAQQRPASCSFSDYPPNPGVTVIKASHMNELRACIGDLRAAWGLPPFSWTDPALDSQTVVKAAHVLELRAALAAVYASAGATSPYYAEALSAGITPVRAAHIQELRSAALSAPVPASGGGGGTSGGGGALAAGQVLSTLTSPDGRFQLIHQGDGNIVLYQGSTPLWASGTTGPGYAVMQDDGNFVLYTPAGIPIWHSNTWGNPGAFLTVLNNGSAVILDPTGTILWSTAALGSINSDQCYFSTPVHEMVFPSAGGSFTVSVDAPVGCFAEVVFPNADQWPAASPTTGTGAWSTVITVPPNQGATRVTGMFIGTTFVKIDQTSSGEDFKLSANQNGECTPSKDGCKFQVIIIGYPPSGGGGGGSGVPTPDYTGPGRDPGGAGPDFPYAPDQQNCIPAFAGFSLNANVKEAMSIVEAAKLASDPLAVITAWFAAKVAPHGMGEWDYATRVRAGYRDLGNYNYGFIGSALGYNGEFLHGAAGIAQMLALHWTWRFGFPFGTFPGGDDPADYPVVQRGIDSYNAGVSSICR